MFLKRSKCIFVTIILLALVTIWCFTLYAFADCGDTIVLKDICEVFISGSALLSTIFYSVALIICIKGFISRNPRIIFASIILFFIGAAGGVFLLEIPIYLVSTFAIMILSIIGYSKQKNMVEDYWEYLRVTTNNPNITYKEMITKFNQDGKYVEINNKINKKG